MTSIKNFMKKKVIFQNISMFITEQKWKILLLQYPQEVMELWEVELCLLYVIKQRITEYEVRRKAEFHGKFITIYSGWRNAIALYIVKGGNMFYLILNILLAILSITNIVVHKNKLDKIFWSLFAIYSVVMSITKIATML